MPLWIQEFGIQNISKMKNRFLKNGYFLSGSALIGLLILAALCAPLICHYAPDKINPEKLLMPPDTTHFLGTDQLGRDLFARIIYGSRISLTVGITVVCISTIVGTSLGAIAGYRAGIIDYLIMRFTDCMLCFPVFFLILAVIALLEPSVFNIVLILGLTSWMSQARLVRAEILSLKTREFVLAAKAYGASDYLIITRHLIPNAYGPIFVSAVLGIAYAILAESSLSFLGIGIQPPTPSWGNILSDAKSTLGFAWWLSLFPGIAILLAILGFNFLGEGLKECLIEER